MSWGGLSPRGRGHRGLGGELAGVLLGAWPALRCDELAGARPGPGSPGVGDGISLRGSAPRSPRDEFAGARPESCGLSHPALWYQEMEGMDSIILWRGCPAGGIFPHVLRCFCDNLAPKVNGSNCAASWAGLYCIKTGRGLHHGKS